MESRETRFHTGLDIRTAGRTGWPVLSPVDGSVRRIRCSARGYGLALYIGTADGRTVVFAHLDRFFDPAAERLRAAQRRSGNYEQDLTIPAGEIEVRRGQVVALSGETGTGAPHVHLEVRDAGQMPLNPADFLELPDRVAPEVLAVRLVPLDPAAPRDRVIEENTARVAARGRWRVEVLAVDRTGLAPFPVAPRALTLYVDGSRHYRLGHDAVRFADGRQMRLDQRRDERGRWYGMFRREGLTLPGREGPGTAIEVVDRPVELFVVVEDASGRRGEFSAVLLPEPDPRPVEALRFEVGEHLLLLEVPGAAEMPPLLEGPDSHHLLDQVEGGWRLGLDHAGLADGTWKLLRRGELLVGRELRFPGTGLAGFAPPDAPALQDAPASSFYPGGVLELRVVDVEGTAELRPIGRGLELVAHGFVPARPLAFDATGTEEEAVLLMRHDGRRWSALEDGRTDAFGTVARMQDLRAPRIGELEGAEPGPDDVRVVRRGAPVSSHSISLPAWPRLRIAIAEEGAGLPDRGPEVRLGGRPWPARWDPERQQLLLDGFVEPPPGRHELSVVARDRAGRTSERRWTLEFID